MKYLILILLCMSVCGCARGESIYSDTICFVSQGIQMWQWM